MEHSPELIKAATEEMHDSEFTVSGLVAVARSMFDEDGNDRLIVYCRLIAQAETAMTGIAGGRVTDMWLRRVIRINAAAIVSLAERPLVADDAK